MLIEFNLENYKTFKARQSLSMIGDNTKRLPENTFTDPAMSPYKAVRSAVIFSDRRNEAQTSLIKGLAFMQDMVTGHIRPSSLKDFTTPAMFEVHFTHENVRYQYGFKLDANQIQEEWLFAHPHRRPQLWFARNLPDTEERYNSPFNSWYFGPSMSGRNWPVAKQLPPHALFLTAMAHNGQPQLAKVAEWFAKKLMVIAQPIKGEVPFYVDYIELALSAGGVLVVEDLGQGLHPLETAYLVKQFKEHSLNQNNAQLVCTTNEIVLLKPGYLRRDQIWFVETDSKGASHLYPLTDYQEPCKNSYLNLENDYLHGRYGGVPNL